MLNKDSKDSKDYKSAIAAHQKRLITEELDRLTKNEDSPRSSLSSETKTASTVNSESATPSFKLSDYPLVAVNGVVDVVCQVQFKCIHRHCSYSYLEHSGLDVKVGSFVIIAREMKGHEDIGIVTRVYPIEAFKVKKRVMVVSQDREENEVGLITRLATPMDLAFLPAKHKREEELLQFCQHLNETIFQVPMKVYGADFQFDGKVLTFYYTSDTRADYRELVRMMFGYVQVRIKMRKTNLCRKFVPQEFATKALMTGLAGMV